MSEIYSFRPGPTYRGGSRQEMFDAAMEQPLSITSTLLDQAKGGALESFGLGTAIRDTFTPNGNTEGGWGRAAISAVPLIGPIYEAERALVQSKINEDQPSLTDDQYKASASFRQDVPFDPGMTEQRAAALAAWDDAKKVRQFYAQKRPFAAFVGNLGGQALDPINYIPVAGPLVKAAAIGRFGKIAGEALTAAADAASNTALFAVGTAGERAKFGDDVSWQSTVSQIATAALIGAAFGTVSGAVGSRVDARRVAEADRRLSTLRTTQESLIALNEGIDGIAHGNDIRLSPNSTEPMARVAGEIASKVDLPTAEPVASSAPIEQVALAPSETAAVATSEQTPIPATATLDEITAKWDAQGIKSAVSERQDGVITVAKIIVPETERGKGVGTAAMKELTDYADATGKTVALSPSADFGGSKKRLDSFYKSLGFVPNKGKAKDFSVSETMIRTPQKLAPAAPAAPVRPTRPPAIDTTAARPDPAPEGIKQAEASVAKTEDTKALASQYRVDPETGSFHEEGEVAQLAIEGRMTEHDVATMAQAQADFETGSAYAEALKSTAACLI